MLDFMVPSYEEPKNGKGLHKLYPKFIVKSSSDLMICGSDFYAVWNEHTNLWSTKEEDALKLIDEELDSFKVKFLKEHKDIKSVKMCYMWDADSGMIDKWHKYVQRQCRDNYHQLDENLIFSNTNTKKEDYASKTLPYPLGSCDISGWDELVGTLYSQTERHKLEWTIGAIVSGDSKKIEKFVVMYGAPKTGKSTIIKILMKLFDGYYAVFDSKALGSATNAFALEAFKSNPLVAIQHDGDLSRIEDNTRLNSLVSHEQMMVNEKFKSAYAMQFNSFLIMGSNKPVKITDSKSGIIRRLIDVSPSGKRIERSRYDQLMKKIDFELGGIAQHCLDIYKAEPKYYDDYVPTAMIGASNDFYNFVLYYYDKFKEEDGTTLKIAWERYNAYCDEARVPFRMQQRIFKEELKTYFKDFVERGNLDESGTRPWNVYSGFNADKFESVILDGKSSEEKPKPKLLELACTVSLLDILCKDWPAQYSNDKGTPYQSWDKVKTTLKDLDTSKEHYLLFPEKYQNYIVIDFDLKDKDGNKSFELNAAEAAKWPLTYAEVSKGGQGIHLHYIYNGDVSKLSRIYSDGIEVKVFTGKSSLRRRVSRCNDVPIATITSGLPLREEKKVINFEGLKNEQALRTIIKRSLLKEYPPHATVTSVEFIKKVLDDAYDGGLAYDVTDMRPAITTFAGRSSHHALECLAMVPQMKFRSETSYDENTLFKDYEKDDIVIWDFEVFPNGFLVAYKAVGKEPHVVKMPSAKLIMKIMEYKLVGHNTRKYDNHIAMAIVQGESYKQIYQRSLRLTNDIPDGYINSAWHIHWADTLEFPAKKQGLKKWEIELGEHHQELGLRWDQSVPDDMWDLVAEYCINDVIATEALWLHLQDDFLARQIEADLANGRVNDTTNALSEKLIFGNDKHPQVQFHYRNLAEPVYEIDPEMREFLERYFPVMMETPHGEAKSILPYFPGYTFDQYQPKDHKSQYKDMLVGEGGFVWAKPGVYTNVITFDVASMHPHSITSEYLFGKYTDIFNQLMEARIAIKHKDYERAGKMFDGKLAKYLTKDSNPKALSNALKICINSVYGLTAQTEKDNYMSPFRDPRNKDNIVAKRGALFMVDLLTEVIARGGEVLHIKTDSIKVANASKELQEFILNFGNRYGYSFEIEHKFEKICLVNDAVYIAKCASDDEESPGQWTATGKQFAVPYVFKKLFSKEPLIFEDYCETYNTKTAFYLDMNDGLPDVSIYEKEKATRMYNSFHPDKKPKRLNPEFATLSNEQLDAEIAKGHNYIFVGKTGQFCPIKKGCGGGDLMRSEGDKYSFATGSSGYKWLESETVRNENRQGDIDDGFYKDLTDKAIEAISAYCDFEWFCE